MGLFSSFKKKPAQKASAKKPSVKIEMHGYVNGKEVPVKTSLTEDVDVEPTKLEKKLRAQDRQLSTIQKAEAAFESTGDIGALIEFWESIWENGGLLFNGSRWTFRLPDLYFKLKQYDDAIRILNKIKNPVYADRVSGYIQKANKAKEKASKKK